MNQPFLGLLRSGAMKCGATLWVALLALLCVLGAAMPSQAQVSISIVPGGNNRFVEGDSGTSTPNSLRFSVFGPGNQTYRVSYISRSGPIDALDTSKPVAIGGGQLSNNDFRTGTQTFDINTGGGGFNAVNVGIVINGDQYDEGSSTVNDPEFNNEYFYVEIIGIVNTNNNGPGNTIDPINNKQECIIVDDDAPPVLSVTTIADVDTNIDSFVAEGNPGDLPTVYVRVLADHVSGKTVQFRYRTYTGTAAANSDFTAADRVVAIPPNANTENQSNSNPAVLIAIPILPDLVDEADETVVVDIRDPGNTVYGTVSTISTTNFAALATIVDDDAPVISISDAVITEGDDDTGTVVKATFQVKMSTTSVQTVSCSYFTVNGTAVDTADIPAGTGLPADYKDTFGPLSFAPGETTKFISVPILGDTIPEGSSLSNRLETFTVRLSGGSLGVTFGDSGRGVGIAQGTINDDDALPQLFFSQSNRPTSTGDLTVNETDLDGNGLPTSSTANFEVFLTSKSGIPVTFDYSTSDGTAIDGVADPTSSTNPIDYRRTSATLTFTPGEQSQVVSYFENDALGVSQFRTGIPIFGDNVDEKDETFFVTLSNVQGATILDSQAQATIIDNDGPFIEVNGGLVGGVVQDGVVGQEGNTGTTPFDFTVSLSASSVQTITVVVSTAAISATAGQDYNSITNQTLTFLPGETSKIVTVNVIGDIADERNETFALNVISVTNAQDPTSGNGDPQAIGTITDDDATPTITINNVSRLEGTGATPTSFDFTVRLSAPTFQNVSFNYVTADGTALLSDNDYVAASGQITFNANDPIVAERTTKTITVQVIGDGNKEADETFFVNISNVVNADANSPVSDLQGVGTILNDDQDPAGLTITPTTLNTNESGTTKTFTVRLNRQPTADVSIQFSTSDPTEGLLAIGAGTPSNAVTLTFTASNFNAAQAITVTGVDDAAVDGDVNYLINSENAISTDPLYSGQNFGDVSVTNVDDEVPGFRVSAARITTTESGGTATFNIRLNVAPTADVQIPIRSSNPGEGRLIDPATGLVDTNNLVVLTFTPGNFSAPQTVTVRGQDDAILDGNIDYVIITDTATGPDTRYNLDPADVAATNTDNDTPSIIVTPASGLRTTEAGGTATFTVRLSTAPSNPVRVPLRTSDPSEGLISTTGQTTPKASFGLIFTATNFNVPQTVTITGQDDAIDDGDVSYTIITDPAVSTDPAYNGLAASNPSVRNTDNENPEIRVSPSSLTVNENSGTASFTVVLVAAPTTNVTIPVISSNTGEGTVFPSSLTFTPTNFNTPQTVVVTAVDDLVDDGDVNFTILLGPATSTDSAYNGLSKQVSVTNVDNDTASIQAALIGSSATTEAGGIARFTVVLTSQPTQTVTVQINSSDPSEGTVLPTSLVFTAANYNTPRTVTVTGTDDAVDDGNVPYFIATGPAVSADTKYNGLSGANIALTNTDNDTRGATITPTNGLRTTEARGRATFTIVLNSQPTADVRIPLRSSDVSEGKPTVSSVTFTATNYTTPQTVTLVGVNDFVDDGNVAYQIETLPAVSNDTVYKGFNAGDVAVTNVDDDVAGVVVTPIAGLTTTESGGTATFTIRLASEPTTNVTVDLSSNNTNEGTVSPTRIIFTPEDPTAGSPSNRVRYDTPFTVTVTGVDDATEDGAVTYRILTSVTPSTTVVTDPNYTSLSVPDVVVRNLDNDDTTAPLVAFTYPQDGGDYRTITKVTGTVSDPNDPNLRFVSGVKNVQIRLRRLDNPATAQDEGGFFNPTTGQYEATQNSAQLITASYNSTAGTFSANLPASGTPLSLAEGQYEVRAIASDNAGNTTSANPVTFTVDMTDPSVTITTPTEGASVDSLAQARGTASDNANGSGIAKVEVVVFRFADSAKGITQGYLQNDGSFSSTQTRLPTTGSFNGTVFNWTFDLPPLFAARYFVRAFATDQVGNVSAPATKNFTIRVSGGEEFTGNVTYYISVPYMDSTSASATTTPTKAFSIPPVDPATNLQNYELQRLNPQTLLWEDIGNSGILRRGEGYRLRPLRRGTRIVRPAEDSTRKPLAPTIQEFQVTLRNNPSLGSEEGNNGFNLIGDPFDPATYSAADFLNSRVTATVDGQTFNGTVAEASAPDRRILDSRLFTRNDAGVFTEVAGNLLLPFKGYFVRTFVDGVQVNLKAVPQD